VQAIHTRLEAAASRFMEEVKQILTSPCDLLPAPRERIEQYLPPTCKLAFVNTMSDKIFTKREVQAAGGGPLMIKMVVSNQRDSNCSQLLSANVKVVALDGDFNASNRESWTLEEFESHIVRPRDKVGVVLTGNLELKLRNGEAYLENITFGDISKFTRSGKFRLGVKLIDNLGERVQEGITEPFAVRDRRGEGYKKCDIPTLEDKVWRVEKIAKNGPFCKALAQNGITLVKHFLRQYYKDKKALRNILSNASDAFWKKMVNHAKRCDPGSALYSYFIDDKNIRVFFSSLGQIVGVTVTDKYKAFGDLDKRQKAQVKEWSKDAYECMTYHQPDYEMYGSQPRLIDCSNFQGSIMPGPKTTQPTEEIIHEVDEQATSEGNRFSGDRSQQFTLRRLGSRRVTALPSAEGNNETDVSFGIDVEPGSGPEIQYQTPSMNYNASSVILPCPPADQSVALHQASMTASACSVTVHQDDQISFTNIGPSLGQWCNEQQVDSQYASSFSPSNQADFQFLDGFSIDQLLEDMPNDVFSQLCAPGVNDLQADVCCGMAKPPCRRWVKFAVLAKWLAMLRVSKSKVLA